MTNIAEGVGLTRVNLYSYFSTKEEIFLELCADKRDQYYEALITAFPEECGYSMDVMSEVWAGILNAHSMEPASSGKTIRPKCKSTMRSGCMHTRMQLLFNRIAPMDARKTDSVLFGSGQRPHEERTRFYFDADNIRDEHGQIEHENRT